MTICSLFKEEEDKELLVSFTEILVDLLIEQHYEQASYSIKLTFRDDRLVWKGGRPVGPSLVERELLIRDIVDIATGRTTDGFGVKNVSEDHCLSLITKPRAGTDADSD